MPELFPAFLRPGAAGLDVNATLVVPGLCGFVLVLGAPWAMQNVGPSKTFVLLVGAQIVLSVLADKWIFDLDVAWTKWLGRYRRLIEFLVAARRAAGLTQRDLAARLKQPPSIGKLGSRQHRLDVVERIDLVEALGLKPAKFAADVIAELRRRWTRFAREGVAPRLPAVCSCFR